MACYAKVLKRRKDLRGTVCIAFKIAAHGRVQEAELTTGTSLNDDFVHRCIRDVTSNLIFSKPKGEGIVEVTSPFRFRPN